MTKETLKFFDELLKTDADATRTALTIDVGEAFTDRLLDRLETPKTGIPARQDEVFFQTNLDLYFKTFRDNWTTIVWPNYKHKSRSMTLLQIVEELGRTFPLFVYDDVGYFEYLNRAKKERLFYEAPWPFVCRITHPIDPATGQEKLEAEFDTFKIHGIYLYARNSIYKGLMDDILYHVITDLIKTSDYTDEIKRSLLHELEVRNGNADTGYFKTVQEIEAEEAENEEEAYND